MEISTIVRVVLLCINLEIQQPRKKSDGRMSCIFYDRQSGKIVRLVISELVAD